MVLLVTRLVASTTRKEGDSTFRFTIIPSPFGPKQSSRLFRDGTNTRRRVMVSEPINQGIIVNYSQSHLNTKNLIASLDWLDSHDNYWISQLPASVRGQQELELEPRDFDTQATTISRRALHSGREKKEERGGKEGGKKKKERGGAPQLLAGATLELYCMFVRGVRVNIRCHMSLEDMLSSPSASWTRRGLSTMRSLLRLKTGWRCARGPVNPRWRPRPEWESHDVGPDALKMN
jgi:hypothetical protein